MRTSRATQERRRSRSSDEAGLASKASNSLFHWARRKVSSSRGLGGHGSGTAESNGFEFFLRPKGVPVLADSHDWAGGGLGFHDVSGHRMQIGHRPDGTGQAELPYRRQVIQWEST